MYALLLIVPLAGAAIAALTPSQRVRPLILVVAAAAHFAATAGVLGGWIAPPDTEWLWLDPPGRLVLGLVSTLFFGCALYAVGYLRYRVARPNRIFVTSLCLLLAALTAAVLARHIAVLWIAVELSALVAAPLIYFNQNARSIEATWKYLLVGSVGVALALLGTFFLAYSAEVAGVSTSLQFDDLVRVAPGLSPIWLRAAFVLVLVGYGTKMGLAPMHTWKPDAYGEAPGLAGALFAGGVTSVAFLAILRVVYVCEAAGQAPFVGRILIVMGLLSMGVAGALMVGQQDFKRMLAYSSVEHMGILALGVGIGGGARFGAMLHLLCNGITKGVLFLSAGNLHRAYASKHTSVVKGALRHRPFSASMFMVGFFAITGAPPFGPFLSELTIATAAFGEGHDLIGALFLLFLLIVFVAMGATVLGVCFGAGDAPSTSWRETASTALPIAGFVALVVVLGSYIPAPLYALLDSAATWTGTAP